MYSFRKRSYAVRVIIPIGFMCIVGLTWKPDLSDIAPPPADIAPPLDIAPPPADAARLPAEAIIALR